MALNPLFCSVRKKESGAGGAMKTIVRSIIFASCLISIAVFSRCGGSHQIVLPLTIPYPMAH
jgi:hypothetical protein